MNVRTLCLGILSFREASGYEIKREIEEGLFSHFIDASFGSIYPALTQLNAEGLLTLRSEEQSGRPDKKVYAITEAGRVALAKDINVVPARDKYKSEFLFAMLFQELLPPDAIYQSMIRQLAELKKDLRHIADCKAEGMCSNRGSSFVLGQGEAVLGAAAKYLEEQLSHYQPHTVKAAE